jgi:hypothetical protein
VLAGLTGVACLGELPFQESGTAIADLFEAELDLTTIELWIGKK